MPINISVTVHSANDVAWKSKVSLRRTPTLYVDVTCGSGKLWTTTKIVGLAPQWNCEIPLTVDGIDQTLRFRLRRFSSILQDPILGTGEIVVGDLLSKCDVANGGIELQLTPFEEVKRAAVIEISARNIDANESGKLAVSFAQLAIDGSDIGNSMDTSFEHSILCLSEKLEAIFKVVTDHIDELAGLHPYANIAWKAVSTVYEAVKTRRENDMKIVTLAERMNQIFDFVGELDQLPRKLKLLEENISRILKQTAECAYFICGYVCQDKTARTLHQIWKDPSDKIREFSDTFAKLQESLDSNVAMNIAFVTSRTLDGVERLLQYERLKALEPSWMDGSRRKTCLPGTRTEILNKIIGWLSNPPTSESRASNILWLHGLVGSGKSTVATTIANHFDAIKRQGGYLFFERLRNDDPASVIRTVAYQLAQFDPALAKDICNAIRGDEGISRKPLLYQFKTLLLDPLTNCSDRLCGPIVIVLDALDECGKLDHRDDLLLLLAEEFPKLPSIFRFLITSRRESDINSHFLSNQNIEVLELTVGGDQGLWNSDISIYLLSEMRKIRKAKEHACSFPNNWPDLDHIHRLVASSGGLFIWASTLCMLVKNSLNPLTALADVLQNQSAIEGLDNLYTTILDSSCKWSGDSEKSWLAFRSILVVVLFSQKQLDDDTIDQILGLTGQNSCRLIFDHLLCLFHYKPKSPIYALHASFRDYLMDVNRSGKFPWFIGATDPESYLTQCYFDIMSKELHFNLGHIISSYSPFGDDKHMSYALKIACEYWPIHLKRTARFDSALCFQLQIFSERYFLFWLEALILMRYFGPLVSDPRRNTTDVALSTCLIVLAYVGNHNNELAAFWRDAFHFVGPSIRQNRLCCIPDIYLSSLAFAPSSSKIKAIYGPYFPNIPKICITYSPPYTDILHALGPHCYFPCIFNPSGTSVIRGGDYGAYIWKAYQDKSWKVHQVISFYKTCLISSSCDGKMLAFTNDSSRSIAIWREEDPTGMKYELHPGDTRAMAFSPVEPCLFASCSWNMFMLWNVSQQCVLYSLRHFFSFTSNVGSISWSSNGLFIAVIDKNNILICSKENNLWGLKATIDISISSDIHCHSATFHPSAHSQILLVGVKAIWVYDYQAGTILYGPYLVSETLIPDIKCASFSPDGSTIVYGANNNAINRPKYSLDQGRIAAIQTETGEPQYNSIATPGRVASANILPDGQIMTSIVHPAHGGIYILEPSNFPQASLIHNWLNFSYDGTRLAFVHENTPAIGVYNTEDYTLSTLFEGSKGVALKLAKLSHDTSYIYCLTVNGALLAWDTENSQSKPIHLYASGVEDFSVYMPSMQREECIVVACNNGFIKAWSRDIGNITSIQISSSQLRAITVSKDGLIAVGGINKLITTTVTVSKPWKLEFSDPILLYQPLESHFRDDILRLGHLTFSSDGQHLACVQNGDIAIWNVNTGMLVLDSRPLNWCKDGSPRSITSIAWSHVNHDLLAASTLESGIYLWNIQGEYTYLPQVGPCRSLSFSPTDNILATVACYDGSIRIWDVAVLRQSPAASRKRTADCKWMLGPNEKRLFWIPNDHREGFHYPGLKHIIGGALPVHTKLNGAFAHGEEWTKCYVGTREDRSVEGKNWGSEWSGDRRYGLVL